MVQDPTGALPERPLAARPLGSDNTEYYSLPPLTCVYTRFFTGDGEERAVESDDLGSNPRSNTYLVPVFSTENWIDNNSAYLIGLLGYEPSSHVWCAQNRVDAQEVPWPWERY